MKKLLAVLTILAISSVSLSAFAACGNNTSRTAPTRAPGSTAGSSTTTGAAPAGINR